MDEYEVPGGFLRRLVAHILDLVLIFVLSIAVLFGVLLTVGNVFANLGIEALTQRQTITIVTGWLYMATFESSDMMATPGKWLRGLKVTDTKGESISFLRATGRHFGKILSTIILFMGFLMALFTEKGQALHDLLTSCIVVKG